MRKQDVAPRDRAIPAPRSSAVLRLEFPIAVKLKRMLEVLSEEDDIPRAPRDRAIPAPRSSAVLRLEFPIAVKLKRMLEVLSEEDDIPRDRAGSPGAVVPLSECPLPSARTA